MEASRRRADYAAEVRDLYRSRFHGANQTARAELWATLVDVSLEPWVESHDTVVDLGAGRCEFLHAIECRRKIAVDVNPDVRRHAGDGVDVLLTSSSDLSALRDGAVDVVFASNFFEHLGDASELLATLAEVRRVLRRGGRLLVLQPNVRLVGTAYWDFLDHSLPLTERSLREAVETSGLTVVHLKTRFLPYTLVGKRLPSPFLLRLYLHVRPAQWLFGKQTFLVAER